MSATVTEHDRTMHPVVASATTIHAIVVLLYAEDEHLERRVVAAASSVLGVRMYRRKDRGTIPSPYSIMVHESSRPACAAAVAAPIRKLCPANCSSGRPRSWRACLVICKHFALVKAVPSQKMKKGPGEVPLALINAATAATGQRRPPVLPMITSVPWRTGPSSSGGDRL